MHILVFAFRDIEFIGTKVVPFQQAKWSIPPKICGLQPFISGIGEFYWWILSMNFLGGIKQPFHFWLEVLIGRIGYSFYFTKPNKLLFVEIKSINYPNDTEMVGFMVGTVKVLHLNLYGRSILLIILLPLFDEILRLVIP